MQTRYSPSYKPIQKGPGILAKCIPGPLYLYRSKAIIYCFCLASPSIKTVMTMRTKPAKSQLVNWFPRRAQPNRAADIGSKEDNITPRTGPTRRIPSIKALKDTTVPSTTMPKRAAQVQASQIILEGASNHTSLATKPLGPWPAPKQVPCHTLPRGLLVAGYKPL